MEPTTTQKRPATSSAAPARSTDVTSPPNKRVKVEERPKCVKCGKDLCGNTVEAPGGMYHAACFGCYKCGKKLDRCVNVENKPYCDTCGRAALTTVKKQSMSSAKMKAAAGIVSAAANKSKWQLEREAREKRDQEAKERFLEEKKEKERLAAEKRKQETEERERLQRERQEKERIELEKREKETRERQERECQEREKREADRKEKDRLDKERREKETRDRQERERREREDRERRERETRERQERERREREEREKRERQAREEEEKKRKQASAASKISAAADRAQQLEREREEAQRIDDERRAKAAAASKTPVKSSEESGQSEWLQKVNELKKKREDKKQQVSSKPISTSNTISSASPKINIKKEEPEKPKQSSSFIKESPIISSSSMDNVKDDIELDDADFEVTEAEFMEAQQDIVYFNFEERVSHLVGYLYLKMKRKKWIKRWCVVQDGKFASYSEKPNDSGSDIKKRRMSQEIIIIPLDTIETIKLSDESSSCFIIQTEGNSQNYHFRCDSEDEVTVWIGGLYHHINSELRDPLKREAAETRQAPVIQQGILQQRRRGFWKKFWFCLKNGFIVCYLARHRGNLTKRPKYKLALFDCKIEEYEGEKYNYSAFQITTQTGEEIVLQADNSEDMLFWINAILKEKFLIEETINSIAI